MKAIIIKTRDSVCAGDDADAPHTHIIEVDLPLIDSVEFVRRMSAGYLANVDGVGHSWTARLNGDPIAEINVNGIVPLIEHVKLSENNTLHFDYHSAAS